MPYQPKLDPDAVLQGYTQVDPRVVGAIRGFVDTTANDVATAQQQVQNIYNNQNNDNY